MSSPICTILGRPIFQHEYSVLKFCENLHMFCNGSRDYVQAFEPWFMQEYLKEKLNAWYYTHKGYDMFVQSLIRITLIECKEYENFPTKTDAEKNYNEYPEYCEEILKRLRK